MKEALQYFRAFVDDEATFVSVGLLFVLVFQIAVFRVAERSGVFAAVYFSP
jgi:hypothetical protein